ncbi:antitoxin Xre/MbcA/ParS toxin-binding domain-containing protein [Pseudomonas sp. McL0111]|uniref:antitoxin Xre/MbcA/ParS toxin-binding domain-containing protein n=1 Tax=Pseudomonas sp. McL0111 TaxID=3457357 RepID=UPI00403E894F
MLRLRVLRLQRLTASESYRLYRVAPVTAIAEVVFGNRQKTYRWLNKPKKRLLGSSPVGLFSTLIGRRIVEDMLIQLNEGLAL